VKLDVGAVTEVITVTDQAPIVETTRSQTSTVVDARSVSELPINGRNFLDFTVLTPGVVKDPTRAGDLTFGGQRGTLNSLQVDGADSNNVFFGQAQGRTGFRSYTFSQESVQEFQVSNNSYSAEMGRAAGGVVNVITKSGTNEFHGALFEYFRDRGMNANTFQNNRNRARKGAYHYHQFGGNLGGPIAKDKLFFFFDYDGQRNSESQAVILGGGSVPTDAASQAARAFLQQYAGQYPIGIDNNVYLIKGDWNIASRHRLTVRYNTNRTVATNRENAFTTNALEHTGNGKIDTDNVAGNHTWLLAPITILESRLAYTADNEPGEANSTKPEAIIQNGGTVLSIGRNPFSPRYTNQKTTQWAEALSWSPGSHSFKFGMDMIFQRIDNYFPGNFSGSFTFSSYANFTNNLPSSFTQAFAGAGTDGPLTKPNVNEYAFYLQDSWRATSRLTLNYGIRYDLFDYAQPTVKNPEPLLAAWDLDTSRIHIDKNNWAPRFGFAYRVDNSGKTAVRGGWGMFYGRTPSIMTGTAMSQNGIQVQTYTLTNTFPTYPNILTGPPVLNRTPDIYVFSSDYVQPLTHQWSLNIERALADDFLVTVGYMGVRGLHLSRTRDINRFPPSPITATYSTGGSATILRYTGRPNTSFGRISLFESGASSIYHGGFVQLTKRFSRNIQFLTSYTFSKVLDTKPDFTSVVVSVDDSKNVQDSLNPNLDYGRGNADINHKFIFSGIWDIDYGRHLSNIVLRNLLRGYQLSLIGNIQSGRPLTATIGGDPNGDVNSSSDRAPLYSRNSLNGPAYLNTDMRLTRDVNLGSERVKLRLIFEAFNATNRANFNAIRQTPFSYNSTTRVLTPDPIFLQKTGATEPARILQLAGKLTF
jgi:hypothetical protein